MKPLVGTGIDRVDGKKKVTVLDFTDLQGGASELGKYIAEQLTVNLVMGKREFSVLDRANLKSILAEHKLTSTGLVDPENAKKLIELITQHHGLLIASPEYNSMITPLLKNTIDWCTRGDENPLIGKVAAVVSASPGMLGGVRSMTLARQLLTHLGCYVIPDQCILPQADKAFDTEGRSTANRAREAARNVGSSIVDAARKLHRIKD